MIASEAWLSNHLDKVLICQRVLSVIPHRLIVNALGAYVPTVELSARNNVRTYKYMCQPPHATW